MKRLVYPILFFILTSCDTSNIKESWQIENFVKADSINPILRPDNQLFFTDPIGDTTIYWEKRNVLNPSAIVKGDSVYLFYRAQDQRGTSRIGMAVSGDGLHFIKKTEPVFYPERDEMYKYEWDSSKSQPQLNPAKCYECYFDGVEDPRIVFADNNRYYMTYTAYNGDKARLSIASSADLYNWEKHGLVLKDSVYREKWTKSGAIICREENDQIIATKTDGYYYMYFGDTDLFMARSKDLKSWQPLLDKEKQTLVSVLHPRSGFFDSRLVEPGPYALIREQGILLIYNASNAANFNDPDLPVYTYAAGQALFAESAPWKLLDRSEDYFIYPDKPYEKVGEVNEVCFVEGMVRFKEKWFLYYGTADSKIAVAVSDDR